eukprot:jgi/Bigna1/66505/fgenesh1_pg.1_\
MARAMSPSPTTSPFHTPFPAMEPGFRINIFVVLLALLFAPTAISLKRSIAINNDEPPPALGDFQRRKNSSRTARIRNPETNKDESVIMDLGATSDTEPEMNEPVIEIDYKSGGDGAVVMKSHELMLRHAPGVFGFASKCELDTAADHCAEIGLAAGDPFCTSGIINTCRNLLPQCESFETSPPCDKSRNECCKCAFQMCPLSRLGCQRIDRECYSEGGKTGSPSSGRGSEEAIEAETRRAIQRVFNMLDLDGNTYSDRSELAMLLSAFSSAHTTTWDHMTQAKYLTICSELGATSKLGPSLKEVYKAFARRRGVLYNLMLRAVDSVKSGRQTQLEKHQAKVQTIFALCDENGDGVLAAQEIDKLTAGKATPSVHPGDRISVTRLKMLYLESHFRDLEEDFDRLRNAFKASDSSAVVSSTAQDCGNAGARRPGFDL